MKKSVRKILIVIPAVILLIAIVFFIYVSDYYKADAIAIQTTSGTDSEVVGRFTIIKPSPLTGKESSSLGGKGIIFYPGAKVEETAYLPLLIKLSREGITCVLVKMPFHLAFFNSNAADDVFDALPEITDWYIAGHSLGGAMASSYASKNGDSIGGVILLGAYVYGDVPLEKTLTIYGAEDKILDMKKINYIENVHVIEGGNHAQFGNYGVQKGDGVPSVSTDMQQDEAVEIILDFISSKE